MTEASSARPERLGAVTRRTVWCLGLSQPVCWGILFYMVAIFGELIAAEMGWSRPDVVVRCSDALVVMGATSPRWGWLLSVRGGDIVLCLGLRKSLLRGKGE